MKPFLAFALLTVLGLAAAGCGSTKKADSTTRALGETTVVSQDIPIGQTLTIAGAETIPNVKAGVRVSCKGWGGPGVTVPPRGEAVVGFASSYTIPGKKSPALDQMSLKHRQNGSIRVTCKASN